MIPLSEDYPGRQPRAYATIGLVGVTLLIGLATGPGREQLAAALTRDFGLIPARLIADPAGSWWTLLTHQFLHGSVLHIIGSDGSYVQRFTLKRNAVGLTGQENFRSDDAIQS